MWESLEQVGWVKVLATTGWLYSSVSVIHYFTLFFFIGTIVLVDLRILRLCWPRPNDLSARRSASSLDLDRSHASHDLRLSSIHYRRRRLRARSRVSSEDARHSAGSHF